MNTDRILALASLIEAQPHKSWRADDGFTMTEYVHSCRTPACIAGFACALHLETNIIPSGTHYTGQAMNYLEIEYELARELFAPKGFGATGNAFRETITPQHAAKVLRHLASSGTVDWTI